MFSSAERKYIYFSCRMTFVNSEPTLKYLFTSRKVTLFGYLGLQLSQPKRRKKYRPCYWELLETGTRKNENRVKSGERQKKARESARENTRNHSVPHHPCCPNISKAELTNHNETVLGMQASHNTRWKEKATISTFPTARSSWWSFALFYQKLSPANF